MDFCRPIEIHTQNFTHGLAKMMMVMCALMNSSSLAGRTVTMHMGRCAARAVTFLNKSSAFSGRRTLVEFTTHNYNVCGLEL